MAILEKIIREDGVVECLLNSSNILKSEYNEKDKTLIMTFKGGTRYKYFDVLHRDYIRLEISESQGGVFNKTMQNYKFEKLGVIDITEIKERINELKTNLS
jgi:hypothetical protein